MADSLVKGSLSRQFQDGWQGFIEDASRGGAPREVALIKCRGHKIGAVDFAILDSFSEAFWARSLWWHSPVDGAARMLAKHRVELDFTTGD